MGTLEAGPRYREHLPSIGLSDLERIRTGGTAYTHKYPTMLTTVGLSTVPLVSPTTMYQGPPPPYPYTVPSASSRNVQSGRLSTTDPRRIIEDEKEHPSSLQRQSLPSIHEALGNDNPLPYPSQTSSAPQSQTAHHSNLITRPTVEGPSGPPNPFSNGSSSTFLCESSFPSQSNQPGPSHGDASRSSLTSISTQDSRKESLPSLNSGKSPTQSSRTAATSLSNSQSSGYEYSGPSPGSAMASPNGYSPYAQSYPYQSQPQSSSNHASYPPAPYDNRPYGSASWKSGAAEQACADDVPRGQPNRPGITPQSSNESVKRQLEESCDVESSLNEIVDVSSRLLDFSRHYSARAHQTQRSGPMLGSLPSLQEVDDLFQQYRRTHSALLRIRTAVWNQEHALAEQRAQRQALRTDHPYDDDNIGINSYDFKGGGGFAGADAKKRRGKAAPPGRCHSCDRAETPEWRRGPDGARTLCNACGLHYAKLTRKMGGNKPATVGPNLKSKSNLDSVSPTHR